LADPNYMAEVERAQAGDTTAFAALVSRFQDYAVGTAYGWLADIELARDVAQEAFLDAHRLLGDLREPRAFPGWLRQIVVKHCDRITRRRIPETEPLNDRMTSSSDGRPEMQRALSEQAQHLRFAVEALPEKERIVVALQYFAEATGAEIAQFLSLPESTVKKRLRQARKRLHDEGDRLMSETIDALRASASDGLAADVAFFVALRAGDHAGVHNMVKEDPALVETLQAWEPDLVHRGVLPFANKATPLITAIELGDPEMQSILLDAGADVNGHCGCATAEAPIWAATLFNRVEQAGQLLGRGADPNVESAAGNRPLHLAAMRGLTELVQLLLKHGADPDVRDSGGAPGSPFAPYYVSGEEGSARQRGRTPLEWAEANGYPEAAAILAEWVDESRAHSPAAVSVAVTDSDVVFTGIKALDLFAPLVRGGATRFPFMAGVGMLVLLGELCRRFLDLEGGSALWTGFTQPPFDVHDWHGDMEEFGLANRIHSSLASFQESAEARREAFELGLQKAEMLADSGGHVLAVVLSTQGFESEVETSLLRLCAARSTGSITSMIVTPFPEQNTWSELLPPFSGQIALDRARAKKHLFPAIDPQRTLSDGLKATLVGDRHLRLAVECRRILAAYAEADPEFERIDESAGATAEEDQARSLLRYLCQPFWTTEPFTGRPGESVAREDLLANVEEILNGHA